MTENNIMLLFPQQRNRFSVIHNVFSDLYEGLMKLSVPAEVVEIENKLIGKSLFDPPFVVRRMSLEEAVQLIERGKQFITIDDHYLLSQFHRLKTNLESGLIWAQYFYGHKYIFSQYRQLDQSDGLVAKISGFIPSNLYLKQARFYNEPLKRCNLVAQSLWTALLLNRVYNLRCKGLVYLPVNPYCENFDLNNKRSRKVLIFLGGESDTNLKELFDVLRVITNENYRFELHGFGSKKQSEQFIRTYGIHIEFHSNIERRELSALYNSSLFTINPVYNGNFEMVPIESLLVGTPVISYYQPFLEVTGESKLFANIQNHMEVIDRVRHWTNDDLSDEKATIKARILSRMNNVKVANDLLQQMRWCGIRVPESGDDAVNDIS